MVTHSATLQALGYIGIQTSDWASYGSKLLGLQPIDQTWSTLVFRTDTQ
jgi:hypothetical protein